MGSKNNKMSYVEQNNLKKSGIRRFINSVKFSLNGLHHAYLHEQSLTIHLIATVLVIVTSIVFHATPMQWIIILVMMSIIMVAELFNTAIEAVVDMVTQEYNEYARIAKDTASAAVFVASLTAFGMWLAVFGTKIVNVIFGK